MPRWPAMMAVIQGNPDDDDESTKDLEEVKLSTTSLSSSTARPSSNTETLPRPETQCEDDKKSSKLSAPYFCFDFGIFYKFNADQNDCVWYIGCAGAATIFKSAEECRRSCVKSLNTGNNGLLSFSISRFQANRLQSKSKLPTILASW